MQRRFFRDTYGTLCFTTRTAMMLSSGIGLSALALACLVLPGTARADHALAAKANEVSQGAVGVQTNVDVSSDYQPLFRLNYANSGKSDRTINGRPDDCQLPPVGAISPFPVSLRLGAMVSPRLKFDGGIDATIPGLHLIPGASTRVDADAIVSANFAGVSTLIPVTFDQIFNLNLPISTRIYAGGGIGPYFGDVTRFGGKLILGAQFARIGLEGNLHFSGGGDPLFTVQARIGL